MDNNILKIVYKVSEILNMSIDHFDHRKFNSTYIKDVDLKDKYPLIVAYSDKCSPWCFVILNDMTIITPNIELLKLTEDIRKLIPSEAEEKYSEETEMLNSIHFAEEFLKNTENTLSILESFDNNKLTYYL